MKSRKFVSNELLQEIKRSATISDEMSKYSASHCYNNVESDVSDDSVQGNISCIEGKKISSFSIIHYRVCVNILYDENGIMIHLPGMDITESKHLRVVLRSLLVTNDVIESGRVHLGFLLAAKSILQILMNNIKDILGDRDITDIAFKLNGHSMGGAIVYLLGYHLYSRCSVRDISIITFGSPRVFSPLAAIEYDRCLRKATIRVAQNYSDPIVGLPPAIAGYSHVGLNINIKSAESISIQKHSMSEYNKSIQMYDKLSFSSNGRFITVCANPFRWTQEIIFLPVQRGINQIMKNFTKKSKTV